MKRAILGFGIWRMRRGAMQIGLLGAMVLGGMVGASCGDDDHSSTRSCTVGDANACGDGQVCVVRDAEQGGRCEGVCDTDAVDACDSSQICDRIVGGGAACFKPVILHGKVFDAATNEGIAGAHVAAADEASLVVTGVAVTDSDGNYELIVPVTRDASGMPQESVFTLRVSAQTYLPYPYGIRPAIPIDVRSSAEGDDAFTFQSVATDVALIALPDGGTTLGSVSGTVETSSDQPSPTGTLIVLEGGDQIPAPFAFAGNDGAFTVFNVPAGSYAVKGYKAFLQFDATSVDVAEQQDVQGVQLSSSDQETGSISGQVSIVNAPGNSMTSVVLVPESTFMDTFVRGIVPPGLRAPDSGTDPNVTGSFTIEGVPDGRYVVLAAFENDGLVRDPDPAIAGTQIVHVDVPEGGGGRDVTLSTGFKVTEALPVVSPGADGPEAVDANKTLTFVWGDDSSEDYYSIVVYDAFGNLVWSKDDVPKVNGHETVQVTYGGPALSAGMYYQFRATSHRNSGPISMTEDLLGVFYVPGAVQ
ncbi:MAG: hypothetical protein J7M25_03510 [Deltaproteobacteria bacterium]|nr:hypothetical protein [Deltaproteobacteria bacterium]